MSEYILEYNRIRIGRLLEVLDALVGLVAYRYCYVNLNDYERRPITVVTLQVNDFVVNSIITNNVDMELNSYVTYVGRSSIEIQTDIYQNDGIVAAVSFTMVARDVEDYSKLESIIMNVKECIGTSIRVRA